MRNNRELDFEAGGSAKSLEQGFEPAGNTAARAASEAAVSQRAQTLGAMSNTPLSTSHFGKISEDTAHLSLWVNWGCDEETLFARFHHAQRESQGKLEQDGAEEEENAELIEQQYYAMESEDVFSDMTSSAPVNFDDFYIEGHGKGFVEFGGQLWYMMPHGKGSGDGNRKSHYKYHLKSGDVNIFMRRDMHDTISNVWLEIGSIPLCRYGGIRNALDEVYKLFKAEGITVLKEILSRVDMYADFNTCEVVDFCDKFATGCTITRARRVSTFGEDTLDYSLHSSGRKQTGFAIGRDVHLRCYDKAEELKRDPVKWAVFSEKYDGIPDTLTRVEFQLRRKALKDIQVMADGGTEPGRIEDVDSYLKVRDNLWRYLTCEWFRFTEKPVDRKNNNRSRAKTWRVWAMVQNAVSPDCEPVKRVRRAVQVNPEHNKKMAIGALMSAALLERPHGIDSAGDFIRYFRDVVIEGGRDYFLEVKEKHSMRRFLRVGSMLEGA